MMKNADEKPKVDEVVVEPAPKKKRGRKPKAAPAPAPLQAEVVS